MDSNKTSKKPILISLLCYGLLLLVTPFLLAALIGGNLTSSNLMPWLIGNVAPLTTGAVLGWIIVDRWVLRPREEYPRGRRWLRILAWLLLAPLAFALLIGGEFWTIVNLFRAVPWFLGLGTVALIARFIQLRFVRHQPALGPCLRMLAVQGLLCAVFLAQFLLIFPVADVHLRWQMAYCENYIVPRIEDYKAEHGTLPGSLRDVMPESAMLPPDVEYVDGTLRVLYRADLMDDYVYRSRGVWVEF